MRAAVFLQPEFPDYALLDSGGGEKLERYGEVILRRPDPQALWRPRRDAGEWSRAHLAFERDPGSGGKRGLWVASPEAPPALRPSRRRVHSVQPALRSPSI